MQTPGAQSGTTVAAPETLPTSILIIDGTNIENRCREAFHREDIDFRLFFAKISAGTRLLHTYYFTAPYARTADPQRLAAQSGRFNVLKALPDTTLKLGRHQERQIRCKQCNRTFSTYAEKGTDVAAAVALVKAAMNNEADQLILLAGDNDYLPALELARAVGATVVLGSVISPHVSEHSQRNAIASLRQNCVRYFPIDQTFMQDCWRPIKTRSWGTTP